MTRLHIADAQAKGYTIDQSATGRPWAYKGPRFNPTDACECYTELESELMALIPVMQEVTQSKDSALATKARGALAKLPQNVVIEAQVADAKTN